MCGRASKGWQRRAYQRIAPQYPRYTPQFDNLRNKFLPTGHCCVCSEERIKVFKLPCNHALCMDDIKGYVDNALGNIQLFPVKCPMHYEGCTGFIGAEITKRILTKAQYERFIDFSDRAQYGEGMRCIFCNNFVVFPEDGSTAMVECPYCVQRFCIRCKKPWHYGARCPLDTVDDSLEAWKADSGAQKCPCCHKMIEKSDPDTCHHMVHKITDGIPCVRDRADFCCKFQSTYLHTHMHTQCFYISLLCSHMYTNSQRLVQTPTSRSLKISLSLSLSYVLVQICAARKCCRTTLTTRCGTQA